MGNILGDALRMRQAGFDEMQGFREQRARNLAGQQLARGNYAGGSAELYNAGMLDAGAGVQQLGQQQEDRQRTLGDAETAKRAKMLLQIAEALQTVPEPQRMTALQQAAPLFQAAGVDASVLSQIKPEHLTTPALQAFVGQIAKEQYTLTPGSARYDSSGRLIASQPLAPEYKTVSPGDKLVEVGQGQGPVASAPQGGPRNVRNANPGNIKDGPFARSQPGYKGSDGTFAIFETPEAGQEAQVALLRNYGAKGLNTVSAIVNRWASPSDNNPTPAYSQYVAQKLGVSPDQPLDMNNPQVLAQLSQAMAQFEGSPSSASNGARVIAQGAPKTKPQSRPATSEEKAAFGIPADVPAQIKPDGSLDTISLPSGNNPAQQRRASADLRKEFEALPDVKNFRDVAASYKQVAALAQKPNPTPADDTALTYSFMKMLDPGSVVREGEFAMVGRTAGLPDQILMGLQQVDQGKGLTPQIRQRLVQAAATIIVQRRQTFDTRAEQYRQIAQDQGIDPNMLAPPPGSWRKSRPVANGGGGAGQKIKTSLGVVTVTPIGN